MPVVTLPDGSERKFDQAVSVMGVAADIGPGLAKATLAGKVNGELVEAAYLIESDVELAIVTERDEAGLEVIRHSTAHMLTQAVKLLYLEAKVTIGPVIDDGFYYDFAREEPFVPEDLEKMEARMKEIVARDEDIIRSEMPRDEAVKFFNKMGEIYKAELIASIPSDEPITLYSQEIGRAHV